MTQIQIQIIVYIICGLLGLLMLYELWPTKSPKYLPVIKIKEQDGKKYLEIITQHGFAYKHANGAETHYTPIVEKVIAVDPKLTEKDISVGVHEGNFKISLKKPFELNIPNAEQLDTGHRDNTYLLLDLVAYRTRMKNA
ncbi:hypothetical protein MMD27_004381 [Acinetobacter baumannii]|nr:hypothetical protein [Acinetobacter baumannii]EKU3445992.1 hypothetical protein [Acinetobacter baumannii]